MIEKTEKTGRKTGIIITGGRLELTFAGSFLEQEQADCVISVDAGLEYTRRLGVVPTAIVGDFDTIEPQILEEYKGAAGILWEVHKPEKNETDTELAVNTAWRLGCGRIFVLGATGGRLDHEWSNLQLLKLCLDRGMEAYLVDRQNKVYLLAEGKKFYKHRLYGAYVSFLPLTEEVSGITLTGFKYPLYEKNLRMGAEAGLCVSNELAAEEAEIRFRKGILICVESRD